MCFFLPLCVCVCVDFPGSLLLGVTGRYSASRSFLLFRSITKRGRQVCSFPLPLRPSFKKNLLPGHLLRAQLGADLDAEAEGRQCRIPAPKLRGGPQEKRENRMFRCHLQALPTLGLRRSCAT